MSQLRYFHLLQFIYLNKFRIKYNAIQYSGKVINKCVLYTDYNIAKKIKLHLVIGMQIYLEVLSYRLLNYLSRFLLQYCRREFKI